MEQHNCHPVFESKPSLEQNKVNTNLNTNELATLNGKNALLAKKGKNHLQT